MFERASIAAAVAVADTGTAGETGTSPGDGFAPPDLVFTDLNTTDNNSGLNVGEVFPQTGGGAYVLATATGGVGGSRAMLIDVPGGASSLFYPVGIGWSPEETMFYGAVDLLVFPGEAPDGNFKGIRHHAAGPGNNGELFFGGQPAWAFDWDGDQALLSIGLYYADQFTEEATYGIVPYGENLDDGTFHRIEWKYDRNVSGNLVRVQFWFDGVPIVQPAGPCFASFYSPTFEHPFASYVDGPPGEPSYIEVARSVTGGTLLGDYTIAETVSAAGPNRTRIVADNLAASAQRIGPTYPN